MVSFLFSLSHKWKKELSKNKQKDCFFVTTQKIFEKIREKYLSYHFFCVTLPQLYLSGIV
jgi:hypothetical protein